MVLLWFWKEHFLYDLSMVIGTINCEWLQGKRNEAKHKTTTWSITRQEMPVSIKPPESSWQCFSSSFALERRRSRRLRGGKISPFPLSWHIGIFFLKKWDTIKYMRVKEHHPCARLSCVHFTLKTMYWATVRHLLEWEETKMKWKENTIKLYSFSRKEKEKQVNKWIESINIS